MKSEKRKVKSEKRKVKSEERKVKSDTLRALSCRIVELLSCLLITER